MGWWASEAKGSGQESNCGNRQCKGTRTHVRDRGIRREKDTERESSKKKKVDFDMGVKSKAALAILVLVLFIGTLWLCE